MHRFEEFHIGHGDSNISFERKRRQELSITTGFKLHQNNEITFTREFESDPIRAHFRSVLVGNLSTSMII